MQHRVKMIRTVFASEDGIRPKHYLKGYSYTISDYMMEMFINMGAVEMKDPDYHDAFETRDIIPGVRGKGRPKK